MFAEIAVEAVVVVKTTTVTGISAGNRRPNR